MILKGKDIAQFENRAVSLRVIAQTKDLSPPVLEFLGDPTATLVSSAVSQLGVAIMKRVAKWGVRGIFAHKPEIRRDYELYRTLFGFTRNAQFLIGKDPTHQEPQNLGTDNSADRDLISVEELLDMTIGIFENRPCQATFRETDAPIINPTSNLVCIGGPPANALTRWYISSNNELPYMFDQAYEDPALYLIRTRSKGQFLRAPEVHYPVDRDYTYTSDYAMITKVSHPLEQSLLHGQKLLIVAGCHREGTYGAASALSDIDVLGELWNTAKDRDFQAILLVEVRRSSHNGFPELAGSKLVDVKMIGS